MTMTENELDERLRSLGGELDRRSHAHHPIDLPGRSSRGPLLAAAGLTSLMIVGLVVIADRRDDDTDPATSVDSMPSTLSGTVTTVEPLDTTAPPTTEPVIASTEPVAMPATPSVDLPVDSTAVLPPAPIAGRVGPAAVWTGAEMAVWGGSELLQPSGESPLGDGAALDPAAGTWRMLAAAPIAGRSYPAVAWTGTEMIVWGGSDAGRTVADGAAYDPAADTWRELPPAPIGSAMKSSAIWTGTEVLFLGGLRSVENGTGGSMTRDAAAYNPSTNSWRRLPDLPGDPLPPYPQAVWTGSVVLTSLQTYDPDEPMDLGSTQLASYDPTTDQWRTVADDTSNPFLLGIPDPAGVTSTVLAFPPEAGEPIDLLDGDGNSIGQLAGRPTDLAGTGNIANGVWVGNEAVFWMGGTDAWAYDPAAQTWRSFPAGGLTMRVDGAIVTTGDAMLTWGGFLSGPPTNAADDGVAYRGRSLDD